jgi:hypothetical protein
MMKFYSIITFLIIIVNSERVLLAMDKPGYNYEAGHITFGPDEYLYIATGIASIIPQ